MPALGTLGSERSHSSSGCLGPSRPEREASKSQSSLPQKAQTQLREELLVGTMGVTDGLFSPSAATQQAVAVAVGVLTPALVRVISFRATLLLDGKDSGGSSLVCLLRQGCPSSGTALAMGLITGPRSRWSELIPGCCSGGGGHQGGNTPFLGADEFLRQEQKRRGGQGRTERAQQCTQQTTTIRSR